MDFRARFSWLEATRKINVWRQPALLLTLRACWKFLGFRRTPPIMDEVLAKVATLFE
jgi:hypothetical protein